MPQPFPLSTRLRAFADAIDAVTRAVFRVAMAAGLFVVVVQVAVVLLRVALGTGSLWLQESLVYAHATLFLLAAAWTLARDGHVRVDLFYASASPRRKAWIDAAGTLAALFPFAAVLLWVSLPYVGRSWQILERSREASGLPAVFLLKTLIPLFALLMLAQGFSRLARAVLVLTGADPAALAPASPLGGEPASRA